MQHDVYGGRRELWGSGELKSFHLDGTTDNFTLAPAERKGVPVGTLYRITDNKSGDFSEVVDHADGARTLTTFQYNND